MMMNEINIHTIMILALMFAAGLTLGAIYFTALWRVVRKLPEAQSPIRLLLGSFALRLVLILTAFYFLMDGHWERLAVAMIGFMVMKKILTGKLGQEKAV
jgi:F1F0 ATPase subunit 2